MPGQLEGGSDQVTVSTDATEGGTLVRVVAPSRHIRMVDLMPVFEALDLNLVSYTAEPDPDAAAHGPSAGTFARRKHSFRGRFLVTDADGQNLSEEILEGLVTMLQDALHVRLSRRGTVHDHSRRGSMASYATETSVDPDSPSFGGAVAGAVPGHPGASSGHGALLNSHLNPNAHGHHLHIHHSHHHYTFQYLSDQHEHAATASSMLPSDHSISSLGSLLRATSGAASEHTAVPSPASNARHDSATFSFLNQHSESTATLDHGVAHTPTLPPVNGCCSSNLSTEDRCSGGPTTPLIAGSFHPQHTRSLPVPHQALHPPDSYDLGSAMPPRTSSHTPTTLNPSPRTSLEAGPCRTVQVGFYEQSTCAALAPATAGPASSFAAAADHRPASSSTTCGSTACEASLSIAAPACTAAALAVAGSCGTSGIVGSGESVAASGGDASPTSSDDKDGAYTWWSTFSAQDSVARIMSHPARSISAEADLGQAKSLMTKHNISALLVDTGGASPGFITKRDFLKVQFNKNFKRTKVKDVMTQPVISVDISLPIEQCSRVLEAHGVRRVLVRDPSRASVTDPLSAYVGVVSDADLFKCMGAPATSPVVGSMANSSENMQQPNNPGYGALAADLGGLAPLPTLPPLPPLPMQPLQPLLPAAVQPSAAPAVHPPAAAVPPHAQHPLPVLPALQSLSSVASTASMSCSMGPSSMGITNSTGPITTVLESVSAPVAAAAAALAMTASSAALGLASSGTAGSSVMLLNPEASLADRYRCAAALWELDFNELEVTRRIGEGSFGEVLLANFRGTKVAVKRLRGFDMGPDNPDTGGPGETGPSPTQMPIFRQFFEREIEILATIRHPNVVNFIGACHTPPNVCLVTEYCARGSLDHLLHKSSITLDLAKKVEFSMDIARGMSCLHSQKPPIIHRDLKTANLLVSARFEVKVADFGLSRIKDHAQLINSRAGLEGTVEYAAPEVLRGEPYTEKCDIWSYAVLLWEIIHRQRPYADADVPVYILMMSLGNGTLRLPPVREELATPGLVRLVDRCMAWHPAERPSFREVLHALELEYKILRGKAAAVPRSDSASCMMMLPAMAQSRGAERKPPAAQQPRSRVAPAAAAANNNDTGTAAQDASSNHPEHHSQQQQPQRQLQHQQQRHHHHHHHHPPLGPSSGSGDAHAAGAGAAAAQQARPSGNTPHPLLTSMSQRKGSKLCLTSLNPALSSAGSGGGRGAGGGGCGVGDSSPPAKDAPVATTFVDEISPEHHEPHHHHHHHHHNHHNHHHHQHDHQQQHSHHHAPHQHQQPNLQPHPPSRPRVKLVMPVTSAAGASDHSADPTSPGGSSRPPSSRTTGAGGATPAAANRGHVAAHKPGSAGRHQGRSLRSAARSKSMPLPEFEWFGPEEGSEEATDSVADEEGEGRASRDSTASGGPAHAAAMSQAASADAMGHAGGDDSGMEGMEGSPGNDMLAQHLMVRLPPLPEAHGAWATADADSEQSPVAVTATSAELRHGEGPASGCTSKLTTPFSAAAAASFQDASDATGSSADGEAWGREEEGHDGFAGSGRGPASRPAVPNLSPFHLAASSPFADAADQPWSPRVTEESTTTPLASRLSAHLDLDSCSGVERQPCALQTPEPAAAVPAAAALPPRPPRAVAFLSPFAQLASEVRAPSSEDEAEADDEQRRSSRAPGAASGPCGNSTTGSACTASRPVAAASTANSTDVHVAIEKDQQSPPDACWGVLGTCSKPPSGDVYPSSGAGRISPVNHASSPQALASAFACMSDLNAAVDGALGIDGGSDVAGHEAVEVEAEEERLAVVAAAAGLEALTLTLPGVMAFAGTSITGAARVSEQFGDEEEDDVDATLHTTAWVRL
ncbi:hypothetical protein Agub_g2180 [Astrephomene gubernaculifera]|uniref:Protein kinase domain-containing protein n=1 Tax=Astrephomene gubernaculifera TaxID=47775 RepID=A0AAD3DGN7_9CHLO|nr:hypothetical protein Agub_g2180 [Astrephomene gubernaculifera]